MRATIKLYLFIVLASIMLAEPFRALSQESSATATSADGVTAQQLRDEIRDLRQLMLQLRAETEQYREEVRRLQQELRAEGRPGASRNPGNATEMATTAASGNQAQPAAELPEAARVSKLEDDVRLLSGKVDDQYQTKVESASKYRMRLSGIALFNAFANRGSVDSIDVPQQALMPGTLGQNGSVGATLRQSQIGLEVFGPEWQGARVDANVNFDFAGGFPNTSNGVVLGVPRLRTGTVNLRWPNTTLVMGQDAPFFSALSPTSLASLYEPVFAYSGNLWSWTPQVRLEHRFRVSDRSSAILQGGLLDPLTGETPGNEYQRLPQAGEVSHTPAFATRAAWASGKDDSFSIGAGAYFNRQSYGFGRIVDGWAGTLDWEVPLVARLSVRGEFFRGSAIGGLGAAGGDSIVVSGDLSYPQAVVRGLNVVGGWSQLKFRATPALEFNGGYGQDNPFSSQLRQYSYAQARFYPGLGINRDVMINSIYRARSNLLLSLEYRHLYSAHLLNPRVTAEHVNAAIGVLF